MSATKKKKKQEPKDKLVVRDSSGNNVKFSDRLNKAIQDAADVLLNFRDLWEKVKQIAKEEGVDEKDCQKEFRQRLRGRLNKDQAYYLFNKDKKKQYSKEQYSRLKNQKENSRNIPSPCHYHSH